MRRLALLTLALIAFAPAALAANETVSIGETAYTPASVTIAPGESVTWTYNNPTTPHGVRFDGENTDTCPSSMSVFAPACPSRQFPNPGRFRYYDYPTCPTYESCPMQGIVAVDAPASASFTPSPNPARRDEAVTFTGSASEPGGTITNYAWDFGDGTTASGPDAVVSHYYASAGGYTATLTVTDDLGNTVTTPSQTISVFEPDDDADGKGNKDDACPYVPADTANGCPLKQIDVDQTTVATLSVEGLLRDGLIAVIECTGSCGAVATLLPVSGVTAAQVGAPLATATGKLDAPGTLKLTLRLTPAAKAALKKVKTSARLRLDSAVTDSIGRVKATSTALTVKKVPSAKRLPRVGISDQQSTTFTDPLFTVLGLRYARLVTPWNSIFADPGGLHAWMEAAYAAGVKPLIAFNHARGDLCPKKPCRAPSVRAYTRAFKAFRKKYPWVTDFTAWNEANHSTQPTGKKPKLAAQYYNAAHAACKRCRITAADALDQNNMRRWLTEFKKHVKGKPRLWGLHNYRDTNRFRDKGTKLMMKLVPGEIWLTETGGIVRFVTAGGDVALPRSEGRAKRAMDYVFKLSAKYHKRLKRAYIYQWRVNFEGDRFDAGVVSPGGKPRPSYDVVSLNASAARR